MLQLSEPLGVWRKRNNFFVSRSAQGPYLIQYGVLILLAIVLVIGNSYVIWHVAQPGDSLLRSMRLGDWTSPLVAFVYVLISIVASIGLYGLILMIYSHRIASPAEKIAAALQRISAGDYEVDVKLRNSDQLQDLATAVNDVATTCQVRRAKLLHAVETIAKLAKTDSRLTTPLALIENAITVDDRGAS